MFQEYGEDGSAERAEEEPGDHNIVLEFGQEGDLKDGLWLGPKFGPGGNHAHGQLDGGLASNLDLKANVYGRHVLAFGEDGYAEDGPFSDVVYSGGQGNDQQNGASNGQEGGLQENPGAGLLDGDSASRELAEESDGMLVEVVTDFRSTFTSE